MPLSLLIPSENSGINYYPHTITTSLIITIISCTHNSLPHYTLYSTNNTFITHYLILRIMFTL
jgi:hypothetical protein